VIVYRDAGDPPTLQTDGQTDRWTTCHRKTVLSGIADIIGIADIVLLSILPIDPALDGNVDTTWNDNAKIFFQNEHSVLGNANTKYDELFIRICVLNNSRNNT